MSFVLSGVLQNQSPYALEYAGDAPSWGTCEINVRSVAPNTTASDAFVGMSEGIFQGCEGTVTYGFTDQHGRQQYVQLAYNDPFSGSNSASISVPTGMVGNADVPSSGSHVTATYTLSGEVSADRTS